MGISRDSIHKRRSTGGRQESWRKKRKFELGRVPANTKLSTNTDVRVVRCRGGNKKFRALRLDHGNFAWGSEAITKKARILDVVYNASNNELVRTKTLVKGAIVTIDASGFKNYYAEHYNVALGKDELEERKMSSKVTKKLKVRNVNRKLDGKLADQFQTGRLFAKLSSRPGQCGRADGYVLEGKELEFYVKKMQKKKGKSAA